MSGTKAMYVNKAKYSLKENLNFFLWVKFSLATILKIKIWMLSFLKDSVFIVGTPPLFKGGVGPSQNWVTSGVQNF